MSESGQDGVQDGSEQINENVEILSAYGDVELLTTLKAVLQDRAAVIQEIVDWAVPDLAYANVRLMTEHRQVGAIKSFNDANGYGFIDCPAVHEAFGQDVFLHRSQRGSYQVGQEVTFAILLNKERKPQAFDLSAPSGQGPSQDANWKGSGWESSKGSKGWEASKGDVYGWAKGGPQGNGAAKGKGAWGPPAEMSKGTNKGRPANGYAPPAPIVRMAGAGAANAKNGGSYGKGGKGYGEKGKGTKSDGGPPMTAVEEPGVTDRRFDGLIKSFNDKTGFGFISCDELMEMYNCDVFVHHRQMANFSVGTAVSFGVVLNKDHKPQAVDLAGREDWSAPAAKRPRMA